MSTEKESMKMTDSLELQFLEPSKDDLPVENVARIYVKKRSFDEEGRVFITPHCVSMSELEHYIEQLKRELDDLKKKAKKKFTKEH